MRRSRLTGGVVAALAITACSHTAKQTAVDAAPPDAGTLDGAAPDAPVSSGSGCPGTGDPVACDDHTGSLGTATACPLGADPSATASYHLQVSGTKFATSGACVYVTAVAAACVATAGDVVEFDGSDGTGILSDLASLLPASPACFRTLAVKWDTEWEDNGLTTGGPLGMGGDLLGASQKPQAVIAWIHEFSRTSATTPLCGRGNSAGSSELLYQLMHDGGEQLLDHVQLVSTTPFGRIDQGCDANAPTEGTSVVCSALPASTEPEYNSARGLLTSSAHDPNCDAPGSTQTPAEAASLRAMSVVPADFVPLTLHKTSLSAYMCTNAPNATQGQAVAVFGVDVDLAQAGTMPYTGVISVDVATPFYSCAANTTCLPHVVCSAACSSEDYSQSMADKMELIADLRANCVMRH